MLGLCKCIHKIIEFIVELEQKVFIVSDNNSTQNKSIKRTLVRRTTVKLLWNFQY